MLAHKELQGAIRRADEVLRLYPDQLMSTLRQAAFELLNTLPPQWWSVHTWNDATDCSSIRSWPTEEEARIDATSFIRSGARRVEIQGPGDASPR